MHSMRLSGFAFAFATLISVAPASAGGGGTAAAAAKASASISIKADVSAKAQAQAAAGDSLYAAGKYEAALAAYGDGFAASRDAAFVYAMAECHKALAHKDDAKAMFNMYLSASGNATLKYKAEAETELGIKAKTTGNAIGGAVGGVVGGVKDAGKTAVAVVADVGAGVYSATKVSVAASMNASAKASAEAADKAYATGKYEDAAKGYLEAYGKSQESVALYAAAQAKAQAGHGVESRGLLLGYLVAQPSGTYAKDAKTLLLAMGGRAEVATKVSVSAKVDAAAKVEASAGDKAMAAGKFIDAAKSYEAAVAKKSDASLIYAKGMAQFYAGQTTEAAASLKAYLAASGKLEFKASAEATLAATGSAS